MPRNRLSLDGTWQFWVDPRQEYAPDSLPGDPLEVVVPAPWQTQHESLRDYSGTGWYRHGFDLPSAWVKDSGSRLVLGFGAADWQAEAWLNGVKIGEHENGYLPFELDATDAARPGQNVLVLRVVDNLEAFEDIPHGKQSWYGVLSGLWQPVWLEQRPERHLLRARVQTSRKRASVQVETSAPLSAGDVIRLEILDPDNRTVGQAEAGGQEVQAEIESPRLWDVAQPNLYTARLSWLDAQGKLIDSIQEQFGFRTIETREGQILLNGRPLYVRAALDQDYYPDLVSTPPSLEYIKVQFRQALAMGLNMLRVHIKVADPRYYQAADEVGLLIWTELPNWAMLTERAKSAARQTLAGMLARDFNHPSIVIWTIINESWGVDLTNPEHRRWLAETYNWMKALDPTRLVVGNSACSGNAQVATDIADFHNYYAMPDHAPAFAQWVETYAARPDWLFAPEYPGCQDWRAFLADPWKAGRGFQLAAENMTRGDEPLLVSEFGNWGLPDIDKLLEGYDGQEPWWFETGYEWGDGVVYPHGIQRRFADLHLPRAFSTLNDFTQAHQRLQFEGMKYEIEQMRIQNAIQGYVITEFTDVHWECNGLLDMHRNPKAYFTDMPWLNADTVLIPEWERTAYWSGETCWVRVYLSDYGPQNLHGSSLEWSLEGFPEVQGSVTGLETPRYGVKAFGNLSFDIPAVTRTRRARLELRLRTPGGEIAAYNRVDLLFFPHQRRLLPGTRVYTPDLARPMSGLGGRVVADLRAAHLVVTNRMTDELRQYILDGGRVLYLAESSASAESFVPGLRLVDRPGSAWQGDWASSVGWVYRDRLFRDLPGEGLVDFAFAGLTPEAVVAGVPPRLFATQVQAGMAVGWLHKAAATIVDRPVGHGRLLVSTFRLSENIESNPLAAYLVAEMVRALTGETQPVDERDPLMLRL
jgi:hypothetical protein